MVDFVKARRAEKEVVSLVNLPLEVNYVFGNTAVVLTKPTDMKYLTVMVEVGAFRVKSGDHAALSNAAPAATVADGTGSLKLVPTDGRMTIPAPDKFTVRGVGASDALVYFWS